MTYFTFTRLNLYVELLVIGFKLFIALWKALNKKKQIAQFMQEILHRFVPLKMTLKRIDIVLQIIKVESKGFSKVYQMIKICITIRK